MTDIGERVARLEDRAELQDLIVRYFIAADGDDLDGLAATFASNARFSISGQVGGATRESIIAFLVEQRGNMGLTLHTPNYALFTFRDPDTPAGLVGAHLQLTFGSNSVFGAVRYQDAYVREDGAWRILSRDMRTMHMASWSEVGEAFASAAPVRWPGAAHAASELPRTGRGMSHG